MPGGRPKKIKRSGRPRFNPHTTVREERDRERKERREKKRILKEEKERERSARREASRTVKEAKEKKSWRLRADEGQETLSGTWMTHEQEQEYESGQYGYFAEEDEANVINCEFVIVQGK